MSLLTRLNIEPPDRLAPHELREWGVLTIFSPVAGFAHLFFLFFFLGLDASIMAAFNVGSVTLWALASICIRTGRLQLGGLLALVEVLGHAIVAALVLGAASGFHYWLLLGLVVPLIIRDKRGLMVMMLGGSLSGLVVVQLLSLIMSPIAPLSEDVTLLLQSLNLVGTGLLGGLLTYSFGARADELEAEVRDQHARSEALLHNILPISIAERLKDEETIADRVEETTIFFSDIVGFTTLSASVEPEELVELLNRIFVELDRLCDRYGLEKIKTIGDAYMAAAGLPEPRADHAEAAARFALDMLRALDAVNAELGSALTMRIGLHSGPVVAGVIGERKFSYDVWGDTVNTAARMESHGAPGRIQISQATRDALGEGFTVEPRGDVEIKGKGTMQTFFLLGE